MSDTKTPPPPRLLGGRGRKLWRELHAVYEFDTHEVAIVLEACRLVGTIDALQAAIDDLGVIVTGSQGQPVVNGAVAELRQQQLALTRLLTVLNLDAAGAGAAGMVREITAQAQRAANARWSKSKEVRGA